MKEREELHTFSKDSVKHWENTIEVCCFNFYFPTSAADQIVKPIFRPKTFIRLPSYVYLAGATHIYALRSFRQQVISSRLAPYESNL